MWQTIISAITGLGGTIADSYNKKQELKDAKHKRELERITNNEDAAGDADIESLRKRGWSDEYLMLLVTVPIALMFLEPLFNVFFGDIAYQKGDVKNGVMEGFEALALVPDYWWYALAGVYIDVFGFRRMMNAVITKVVQKKIGN